MESGKYILPLYILFYGAIMNPVCRIALFLSHGALAMASARGPNDLAIRKETLGWTYVKFGKSMCESKAINSSLKSCKPPGKFWKQFQLNFKSCWFLGTFSAEEVATFIEFDTCNWEHIEPFVKIVKPFRTKALLSHNGQTRQSWLWDGVPLVDSSRTKGHGQICLLQ